MGMNEKQIQSGEQNLELSESLRAAIEKLAANSNKQKLRRNL
jgi:hypothetical protein